RTKSSLQYNFGLITLAIQPWIAAETVYRIYRDLQRAHYRQFPPSCQPEKLRMYKFTRLRRHAADPVPTWSDSMKEWNKSRPKPKRQYQDFTQFRRDYLRTESWLNK